MKKTLFVIACIAALYYGGSKMRHADSPILAHAQQLQNAIWDFLGVSAPSAPASGVYRLYMKAGVGLCFKDSTNTEVCPTAGGGGASGATILDVSMGGCHVEGSFVGGSPVFNTWTSTGQSASAAYYCHLTSFMIFGFLANSGSPTFTAQRHLPPNYDSTKNINLNVYAMGSDSTSGTLQLVAAIGCAGDGGTVEGPSFNTSISVGHTVSSSSLQTLYTFSNLTRTGCAANSKIWIQVSRDNTVGGNLTKQAWFLGGALAYSGT